MQVELSSHKAMAKRSQKAFVALQDAARRSGDRRLLALASALGAPGKSVKTKFDPIIRAIDKMVKQLHAEEETDLETKQTSRPLLVNLYFFMCHTYWPEIEQFSLLYTQRIF